MKHSILKFPILSLLFSLNFMIHLKLIFYFFSFDNREKNCKKTAKIIIPPPNNIRNVSDDDGGPSTDFGAQRSSHSNRKKVRKVRKVKRPRKP